MTSIFLDQWHEGDPKAMDALVERHLPWIRSKVKRRMTSLLRQKGETMDYVQDAVVQFLKHAPHFRLSDETQFRALLFRIVENSLLNQYDRFTAYRRSIFKERPLPPDTVLDLDPPKGKPNTPSMSVDRHEREAWIRLAMEFLDPDDREVIVLRQWDGLSFSELGKRLNVSTDAARMRHNRALTRLSKRVWELRSGNLTGVLETCDQ